MTQLAEALIAITRAVICKRIVQNHHSFIKAFGKETKGAFLKLLFSK